MLFFPSTNIYLSPCAREVLASENTTVARAGMVPISQSLKADGEINKSTQVITIKHVKCYDRGKKGCHWNCSQ